MVMNVTSVSFALFLTTLERLRAPEKYVTLSHEVDVEMIKLVWGCCWKSKKSVFFKKLEFTFVFIVLVVSPSSPGDGFTDPDFQACLQLSATHHEWTLQKGRQVLIGERV